MAKPTLIVAFAVTAILFYACNRLHDRLEQEKKKDILDKIAADSKTQASGLTRSAPLH